jgi:DNA helicase HerA-like ATPase
VTQPLIRVVLGQRGTGKSTLARQLVADERRLLIFDPMAEHDALRLDYDDFAAYLDDNGDNDPLRVALTDLDAGEEFCAFAWVLSGRRPGLAVFIEEADLIAPPGQEPPILRRLIAQGRHRGVAVVACSRRPAEVSRFLTAQAHELYLFRMVEPRDLAYIRAFCGADVSAMVQALGPHDHVAWTVNGHQLVRGQGGALQLAEKGRTAPKNVDTLTGET